VGRAVLDVLIQFRQSIDAPQRSPRSSNAIPNSAIGGEVKPTGFSIALLSAHAISEPEKACFRATEFLPVAPIVEMLLSKFSCARYVASGAEIKRPHLRWRHRLLVSMREVLEGEDAIDDRVAKAHSPFVTRRFAR
jgi:hypothetical protein